MSARDRFLLECHQQAVWAEELLRGPADLTPEGLRHLTLLATGDADAADRAAARAELERMRRQK